VYALKRALDPAMRSNSLGLYEGRFVGADTIVAKAKQTGKFDYDTPVEGLQAIDRYTLRFKLNFPDAELLANLTVSGSAAVAREVVEAYGDGNGWTMANPVGTGPYRLKEWRRGASVSCSGESWLPRGDLSASSDPADRARSRKLAGRRRYRWSARSRSACHRGSQSTAAFVRAGPAGLPAGAPSVASNVLDPGNKLKQRAMCREALRLGATRNR
jgi:hypothetical protein